MNKTEANRRSWYVLIAMWLWSASFIVCATAMAEPPASVVKYEASIPKLKALGHPSPVYTASCPDGLNGELVAFGCLDIMAMIDAYEGPGYQFPSISLLGKRAYRYLHPEWRIPLYFSTKWNKNRAIGMLKSGKVRVAYGGWCTAGVEDLDVHFSSPNKAPYRIEYIDDGSVDIYLTNMAKTQVQSKPELQEHVANWLDSLGPDEVFNVRGLYVPVMLDDYAGYQPPREGVHWRNH